ncbi:MAG: glycosyltransferase family 9 protein [Verrucomicrobiales bacterium]
MSPDMSHFKRVVVYRIGSLGDTLVVLPAFHLVRRVFPEAHITLLTNVPVNAKAAPMEAILQNTNLYNDILRYPTSLRGISKLLELRKTLEDGRYDCLIYLTEPKGGLLTSLRDFLFFQLCGIRRIVGLPLARHTLRPVPVPGSDRFTSETTRVLECIRSLGSVDVENPASWDLQLTPGEIGEADALLRSRGISGRFLAASVGTKIQPNDWEQQNWRRLMDLLTVDHPRLPLVLFGATEEHGRCQELSEIWKGPKANLCGVTSPRVSAAALRGATVMICHDSGPMHLAATMGVPCVAIFSARNPPGVWYPRGENHTVLYHRTPCWGCKLTTCIELEKACILSIPVEEVRAAVRKHLALSGIPSGGDFR